MKRRDFLQTSALTGAALGITGYAVGSGDKKAKSNSNPANYNDFDLLEVSVTELQDKMRSGELTSETICQKYLNRIAKLDKEGPAMMFSFLGSCKLNGTEPFAWLKDVLSHLSNHPRNRLDELLLDNWLPGGKD